MKIFFSKYQASGNDFILIDNRKQGIKPVKGTVERLCDRHFAVGADGVILLQQAEVSGYDFEMKYYNPDGSSGMFCGNGGRCIVAFARDLGLISKSCSFVAPDGSHTAEIRNDEVKLSMQDPTQLEQLSDGWFVNTGTQHFVKFVPDLELIDVCSKGRELRHDSRFEKHNGTNVSFAQQTPSGITLRTYERGVEAETLSCGTAITAAAVIHIIRESKYGDIVVEASTKGGCLQVCLIRNTGKITDVFLRGQAVKVYDGQIKL